MTHQEFYEAGAAIDDNGTLMLDDRHAFRAALKRFKPGKVSVRVFVQKETRSLQQNKFWWGTVIPLFSEYTGYDKDDMHDVLALKLLPKEVIDYETGEVKTIPGHTSKLTTTEFTELIERAQRLGAEMGIYVPSPNEVIPDGHDG